GGGPGVPPGPGPFRVPGERGAGVRPRGGGGATGGGGGHGGPAAVRGRLTLNPPSGQVAANPRTPWAALSGTAMRMLRLACPAVRAGRRGPPHPVGGAEWHRHANVAACPARCLGRSPRTPHPPGGAEWHRHANVAACPARCLGRSPRTPHLVSSVAPPCESC